jgi:hypothetical protein
VSKKNAMKIVIIIILSVFIIEQTYTCFLENRRRESTLRTNATRLKLATSSTTTKTSISTETIGIDCDHELIIIKPEYELPCESIVKPCYHGGNCIQKCIFLNNTHMRKFTECNCKQVGKISL